MLVVSGMPGMGVLPTVAWTIDVRGVLVVLSVFVARDVPRVVVVSRVIAVVMRVIHFADGTPARMRGLAPTR